MFQSRIKVFILEKRRKKMFKDRRKRKRKKFRYIDKFAMQQIYPALEDNNRVGRKRCNEIESVHAGKAC